MFDPQKTMWCRFSHCNLQLHLIHLKKIWWFFFASKLLVPTSVLSTVGGYHCVPVALTGGIAQCLKQPRISNSKCTSLNLASHFITTITWLWENNKFRTGLVLAKSWCTTPIVPPQMVACFPFPQQWLSLPLLELAPHPALPTPCSSFSMRHSG